MADVTAVLARPAASRRRRWQWILAAFVIVVVAAGVPTAVWFSHWRSHLHSLVDYPNYGAGTGIGVGQTLYFGGNAVDARAISHPLDNDQLSLHITAIRPLVRENTAAAAITVMRCVLANGGPRLLGADEATAHSTCGTLTPFHAGSVTLGFSKGDDDIVLAVTPRHAGTVQILGVELQYRSGLRHGTQHTGAQITTTTK